MARKVFYSFHYIPDNWRAAQVRNMGVVEGNQPVSDNDWESVKRGGDSVIKSWIDGQMEGRSCAVVLIGSRTAGRKWINYEIEKAWNDGKGVVGIYVHNLKDRDKKQSIKGLNPFDELKLSNGKILSAVVQTYDPPSSDSQQVYGYIDRNLEALVEKAVKIRNNS
jgi:hypothetical protein